MLAHSTQYTTLLLDYMVVLGSELDSAGLDRLVEVGAVGSKQRGVRMVPSANVGAKPCRGRSSVTRAQAQSDGRTWICIF